jgi:hypothetical protein
MKVLRALKVTKGLREMLVQLVQLDLKEQLAQLDLPGLLVRKAIRAI